MSYPIDLRIDKRGRMKKTLIAITILMASVASAGEITKEQLVKMYKDNEAAYMTITPGMTADYHNTVKGDEECSTLSKEVVVAVNPFKYLVYTKDTNLTECTGSTKGESKEYLEWRNVDEIELSTDEVFIYKKITARDNFVKIEVEVTGTEGRQNETIVAYVDVTQSQFYSVSEVNYSNELTTRLIKRSVTDINTLKLEDLEVRDHSED